MFSIKTTISNDSTTLIKKIYSEFKNREGRNDPCSVKKITQKERNPDKVLLKKAVSYIKTAMINSSTNWNEKNKFCLIKQETSSPK